MNRKIILKIAGLLIAVAALITRVNGQQVKYPNEQLSSDALGKMVAEMAVFQNKDYLKQVSVVNSPLKIGGNQLPKLGKKKQDPAAIYAHNKEAVLRMCYSYKCGRCNNNHVNTNATAFLIAAEGLAVTNYHVLESFIERQNGQLDLAKVLQQEDPKQLVDMQLFFATYDDRIFTLKEILAYDKANDIAIFRLDTRGEKMVPARLGEDAPVGSEVFVLSHPSGNPYYFSRGIVSRNHSFGGQDGSTSLRMDITADYAKGSSGGPIFDDQGNVAGLVSATHTITYRDGASTPNDVQMVVKRAVPVGAIKKLIN